MLKSCLQVYRSTILWATETTSLLHYLLRPSTALLTKKRLQKAGGGQAKSLLFSEDKQPKQSLKECVLKRKLETILKDYRRDVEKSIPQSHMKAAEHGMNVMREIERGQKTAWSSLVRNRMEGLEKPAMFESGENSVEKSSCPPWLEETVVLTKRNLDASVDDLREALEINNTKRYTPNGNENLPTELGSLCEVLEELSLFEKKRYNGNKLQKGDECETRRNEKGKGEKTDTGSQEGEEVKGVEDERVRNVNTGKGRMYRLSWGRDRKSMTTRKLWEAIYDDLPG